MTVAVDLAQDRDIARRLVRAWPAFFAAFGRLTPVQRAVIPYVLDGSDVLVCSATATGKTEAACAPLIERYLNHPADWTVLYVSPTRALVNDLYARLEPPLQRLSVRLGRRTGEYHDDMQQIPRVLLTTPESFDSILCRGRRADAAGHVLSRVVALVLDEIHLLYGTARGEQVRWLIERLRRLRGEAKRKGWAADERLQIVGLSATVPDPQGVVEAYMPQGKALIIPGGRKIEAVVVDSEDPSVTCALPKYLASSGKSEKVLVFCNTRRRVDDLASLLAPQLEELGYTVAAHHGSLARRVRLEAEAAAKAEKKIVIFATSTLEIGIDIGDIDLVVLDGPAPDIPALLQRIGRGNRRSNKTRVMTCSGCLMESLVHSAMIEAARSGWLGPSETGPQYAVIRQQIASYIFQSKHRFRSRKKIEDFLSYGGYQKTGIAILDAMIASGELEEGAEGIRLGESWLDFTRSGKIHSNIEGSPGLAVEDQDSGRKIAHGVDFRGGAGIRIGGRLLQVRRWDQWKIEVSQVTDQRLTVGDWRYFSRAWMKGAGQPQAVRRFLGIGDDEWPIILIGESTYVFHFGGARRRSVIELAAHVSGDPAGNLNINEWFLEIPPNRVDKPYWLLGIGPATLAIAIHSKIDILENRLGRPRANKVLPLDVRVAEISGWLNIEDELAAIKRACWNEVVDEELRVALKILATDLLSGNS